MKYVLLYKAFSGCFPQNWDTFALYSDWNLTKPKPTNSFKGSEMTWRTSVSLSTRKLHGEGFVEFYGVLWIIYNYLIKSYYLFLFVITFHGIYEQFAGDCWVGEPFPTESCLKCHSKNTNNNTITIIIINLLLPCENTPAQDFCSIARSYQEALSWL